MTLAYQRRLWEHVVPRNGRPFDYDNAHPFDVQTDPVGTAEGAMLTRKVSYASPRGGRVPALLAEPQTGARNPGVVSLHFGGRQSHAGFIDEATRFAALGMSSLVVDAPWLRPELRQTPHVANAFDLFEQAGVDLLRAAELLASLPSIESGKIAYVGHGFGAHLGAPLAALSSQLRAVVLIAGSRRMSEQMLGSHPFWTQQGGQELGELEASSKRMAAIDADQYLGWSSVPVLHQFGDHDPLVSHAEAMATFECTAHPKVMRFYEADHGVSDPNALADRIGFISHAFDYPPGGSDTAPEATKRGSEQISAWIPSRGRDL